MPLTLAQMHALLPDNTAGDIGADDMRDVVEAVTQRTFEREGVLPPTSGWSWVNQGTGAVTDVGDGRTVLTSSSAGGNNLILRVRTAPATPYQLVVRCSALTDSSTGNGYGICFRESGTGEISTMYYKGSDTGIITVEDWNSATSFNAQLATRTGYLTGPLPLWMRIADNGTNLIYSASTSGFDASFEQIHSVGRTAFMAGGPDQIGFLVRNDGRAQGLTVHSWETV